MTQSYRARMVDRDIAETLAHPGAILLEGARACGKSATGHHHARSAIQLDLEPQAVQLAEVDPALLLRGEKPRLIDEWQLAPHIWNQVRAAVDTDADAAYILAGSAHPADDITRHSGAGRIQRIRMRTMSLAESGHSSNEVSLSSLFDSQTKVAGVSPITVVDLARIVARGGWPGLLELPQNQAEKRVASYLDEIIRADIPRLHDEPDRDPEGIMRVIRSLGRNIATETPVSAIARDAGPGGQSMTHATATAYLKTLERVFVIEDQPSWGPHLRSRDRVRQAAKRHFVDPSLAAAAVGASGERLLDDLEYLGLLFESQTVRDLRIYASGVDAQVRHYRDSAGQEVDAIVERRDGSWLGVEVKLASTREDAAAASLIRFVENLDTSRTPPPTALAIITAGKYAYTRADGIHVIPLATLTR